MKVDGSTMKSFSEDIRESWRHVQDISEVSKQLFIRPIRIPRKIHDGTRGSVSGGSQNTKAIIWDSEGVFMLSILTKELNVARVTD